MPNINKICTVCQETKNVKEFGKDKKNKDGFSYWCKSCKREKTKMYRKANLEKVMECERKYREKNRGAIRERHRLARKKNLEKYREKGRERVRRWAANNPERIRELRRRANKKRYSSPKGKLYANMSRAVSRCLKTGKNSRSWQKLVGYTINNLRRHLEKQFHFGMEWDNYGKWHIDHIIPISVFNYEKPEDDDFKRCWALKNLQPLWDIDNYRKNKSLDKPFQPKFIF